MKKYRVNTSEITNLNSMYDHLKCMEEEMVMGETEFDETEWDELSDRMSEIEELMKQAYCVGALVDWPTLKRIREIKDERQGIRYGRCVAQGMSGSIASLAFEI